MTHITRRGTLGFLLSTVGLAALPAVFRGSAFAQAAGTFKIGVVASMTGPASPFFKEYVAGFQAYAAKWNARGGVKGRKIELTVLDDESGAVQAANGYRRIAGDPETMLAWVAGPGAGGLAIKALASELKLPIVSGGALDILGVPADPYFFKIAPANTDFLKMFTTWFVGRKYKKLGIVLSNDAYGQNEAQAFRTLAKEKGIEIVALETFSPTDTNFSAQLVRVRSAAPDLLYVGASGAPGILLFKQIKQLSLKMPVCFMLAALTPAFFQAIGGAKEADGVMTPGLLGMLGDKAPGDSGKLYADLKAALDRAPSLGTALGWDIGIVTEAALKNSDGSREGIRAALDKIKELPGINGPITYTPQNHIGQDARGLAVLKLQDGKFVAADG